MNSLLPSSFRKKGWSAWAYLFRAFCCVLLLGVAACGPRQETAELSPKEMQAKLNEAMPKGATLANAREFMEKEGFACEMVVDGEFKKKKIHRFLLCTRQDGQMIKRRWDVAVVHDGEKVLSVDMRTALVYP